VTANRDTETRARLLKAAERLFAERWFKKVTVRDICRAARANVAAVNDRQIGRAWDLWALEVTGR
jgi:AcrR family transcriptional regulator